MPTSPDQSDGREPVLWLLQSLKHSVFPSVLQAALMELDPSYHLRLSVVQELLPLVAEMGSDQQLRFFVLEMATLDQAMTLFLALCVLEQSVRESPPPEFQILRDGIYLAPTLYGQLSVGLRMLDLKMKERPSGPA